MNQITYKQLTPAETPDSLLANFTRYQETNRVLTLVNGELIEKEDHFIDSWGKERLFSTSRYLHDCAERHGIVVGAFQNNICIGFVSIEPNHFGSRNQYVELTYCHITKELRGKGLGKRLFNTAADIARAQGLEYLYLSTHPAVETQAFYRAMGCVIAEEINAEILAKEPLDIQLEKHL